MTWLEVGVVFRWPVRTLDHFKRSMKIRTSSFTMLRRPRIGAWRHSLIHFLKGTRPRTVSELASLLEITPQGAAQIVDSMQRRGYVARRPDPRDRRARLVELSNRGRESIGAARAFHRRFEASLIRRHGRETIDQFRSVLGAMAEGAPDRLDRELRSLYL